MFNSIHRERERERIFAIYLLYFFAVKAILLWKFVTKSDIRYSMTIAFVRQKIARRCNIQEYIFCGYDILSANIISLENNMPIVHFLRLLREPQYGILSLNKSIEKFHS